MAADPDLFVANVESIAEVELLHAVATELGKVAPIALRFNPNVDAKTHPYISTGLRENKFGVDIADAPGILERARRLPGLTVTGVQCHIGSQITDVAPFHRGTVKLTELVTAITHDQASVVGQGCDDQFEFEFALDLTLPASPMPAQDPPPDAAHPSVLTAPQLLRRTHPELERPFRVRGMPWVRTYSGLAQFMIENAPSGRTMRLASSSDPMRSTQSKPSRIRSTLRSVQLSSICTDGC